MRPPSVRRVGWCPDRKRAEWLAGEHRGPGPSGQQSLGEELVVEVRVVPVPTGGYEVRTYTQSALDWERQQAEELMLHVEDMSRV